MVSNAAAMWETKLRNRLNCLRWVVTAFKAKSRALRRSLMGVSAARCSSVIDCSTCIHSYPSLQTLMGC